MQLTDIQGQGHCMVSHKSCSLGHRDSYKPSLVWIAKVAKFLHVDNGLLRQCRWVYMSEGTFSHIVAY